MTTMKRRKAREEVLKLLYQVEVGKKDVDEILGDLQNDPSADPYFPALFEVTCKNMPSIDRTIHRYARNWSLSRMATIDRNVLRLAIAEMLYFPDIPGEVSISEAVRLAKKYGDQDSGKFVNGILGQFFREMPPPPAACADSSEKLHADSGEKP